MSYDLFFRTQPGSSFSSETFVAYFEGRSRYTVNNGQAWYANEDTGVYFSFELSELEARVECDVEFQINFIRPMCFPLEAAPEVSAFIAAHELTVVDTQIDGMGEGAFAAERFVASWKSNNEMACRSLAESQPGLRPLTMPGGRLHACWLWNLHRERLQATVGEGIFVPKIMFAAAPPSARAVVVWTDAIPILLPEVDAVVLHRDEYAPRRLFRRTPDLAIVAWRDIEPHVHGFPVESDGLPFRRLEYGSVPEAVSGLFRGATSSQLEEIISTDKILEEELVAAIPAWNASS